MSWLRRKPSPKALTREESLDSRPIRNPKLQYDRSEDGTVVLRVPPNPAPWARFVARILKVQDMERRISLDELGSYVWEQCDGETTVRKIIARFAKRFKLNRKEAEVSITQYLRTLAKKGLIGIMVPRPNAGNS
jgi:hypothetical protein